MKNENESVSALSGVFRPAVPTDLQGVVRLYAVAARVVSVRPDLLGSVGCQLQVVQQRLVPPEAAAAAECERLWSAFAPMVQVPKTMLRQAASRAFYRGLESLGQRLDLPPLADWETLPLQLDEPGGVTVDGPPGRASGESLELVRQCARDVAAGLSAGGEVFPARQAAMLLARLEVGVRRQVFDQLVGHGLMSRGEANLLIRCLVKDEVIEDDDVTLVEVLQRVGAWLAG